MVARSPTIAVIIPIIIREKTKVGHPPSKDGGGTMANKSCGKEEEKKEIVDQVEW